MTTSSTGISFKLLFLLLITFSSISCSESNEVKLVEKGNRFSISIPSFLTEVHNLNEDATLQYQHAWKEFYVIVIEDPKEEVKKAYEEYDLSSEYSNNLRGYTNLVLYDFTGDSGSIYTEDAFIDSLPAKLFSTSENIDGIDVYYSIAVIEGEDQYYQIMTWTLDSKKNQYKEKMNDILYSFKEI